MPGLPGRFYARNIDDVHDRSGGVGQRGGAENRVAQLPAHPTILNADELVNLLNALHFDLLAPPGEFLNYSNEGFCLLGGVLEKIMQRPYAELANELIFEPLAMSNSTIGKARNHQIDNTAFPLLRVGRNYTAAQFWQAPLFYPAGGCVSTARDVMRLISALGDAGSLLSQESKQRIMHLQLPVASRPLAGIGYGLGIEVQKIDAGTTLYWHSGQRAGVSSFMGWLAEEELAISVLCNVADAPVTSIAHDLIGDLLKRSDINWPPLGLTTESAGPAAEERFVGRYASAEGNRFDVQKGKDQLVVSSPVAPQAQRLQFSGPDNGSIGPQTFRFLCASPQSKPWALALDLRVLRRTA